MKNLFLIALTILLISCQSTGKKEEQNDKGVQAYSLLGKELYEPERSQQAEDRLSKNLEDARQNFNQSPSEINYIWLGRRTAYLSRYNEAIEIFTKGLKVYPDSYRLYRHRGHRYISIREFEKAISDLEKAAELMPQDTIEIEPDGIPNKLNQPLSSTQFNVWYHLALAHYLNDDFNKAEKAYAQCMKTSVNPDLQVATADWWYMTLRRIGALEQADSLLASIPGGLNIIENDSYYKRIKMYQGKLTPEEVLNVDQSADDYDLSLATQGYGVGHYHLLNGDTTTSKEIFYNIMEGEYWSAFGYIAAEADLVRLNNAN